MVSEVDEIHIFARPVLRHFQQIDHTQKAQTYRQGRGDIRQRDPLNRSYLDKAVAQFVMSADLDVR